MSYAQSADLVDQFIAAGTSKPTYSAGVTFLRRGGRCDPHPRHLVRHHRLRPVRPTVAWRIAVSGQLLPAVRWMISTTASSPTATAT